VPTRRSGSPGAPPTPLAAVVVLRRAGHAGAVSAGPARGRAAVEAVLTGTAMRPVVAPLGAAAAHFRWSTRLTAAVPVVEVRTDRYRRDLAAAADAVEALVDRG